MVLGPLKFSNRIAILGDFWLIFGYFFLVYFFPVTLRAVGAPGCSTWQNVGVGVCQEGETALEGKDQSPINVSNFQMQITCHNSAENKSFIITILWKA